MSKLKRTVTIRFEITEEKFQQLFGFIPEPFAASEEQKEKAAETIAQAFNDPNDTWFGVEELLNFGIYRN